MSPTTPLPTTPLPAAILETVLPGLAALFLTGAGGNPEAARQTACQMLDDYRPQTENELRLAANVIAFSFHALQALGQASVPGLSPTRILRLRGNAVSLSRESAKAERRLGQLQKARQQAMPQQAMPQQAMPQQAMPQAAHPHVSGDPTRAASQPGKPTDRSHHTEAVAPIAKATTPALTQAEEDRQRDLRIAAGLKRMEARAAARSNATGEAAGPFGPAVPAIHPGPMSASIPASFPASRPMALHPTSPAPL